MIKTHSPTPFYVQDNYMNDKIISDDGRSVGVVYRLHGTDKDAHFIVTAVNSYEANQALIRQLVEALEHSKKHIANTETQFGIELDVGSLVRAALSAAKEAGF